MTYVHANINFAFPYSINNKPRWSVLSASLLEWMNYGKLARVYHLVFLSILFSFVLFARNFKAALNISSTHFGGIILTHRCANIKSDMRNLLECDWEEMILWINFILIYKYPRIFWYAICSNFDDLVQRSYSSNIFWKESILILIFSACYIN